MDTEEMYARASALSVGDGSRRYKCAFISALGLDPYDDEESDGYAQAEKLWDQKVDAEVRVIFDRYVRSDTAWFRACRAVQALRGRPTSAVVGETLRRVAPGGGFPESWLIYQLLYQNTPYTSRFLGLVRYPAEGGTLKRSVLGYGGSREDFPCFDLLRNNRGPQLQKALSLLWAGVNDG